MPRMDIAQHCYSSNRHTSITPVTPVNRKLDDDLIRSIFVSLYHHGRPPNQRGGRGASRRGTIVAFRVQSEAGFEYALARRSDNSSMANQNSKTRNVQFCGGPPWRARSRGDVFLSFAGAKLVSHR